MVFFYERLSKSYEFHIIVIQPMFTFLEMLSIHVLVIVDQPGNPCAIVG